MDLHENLKGKTVVITGGSGILCREFAYAYAKQGMNVAVLGRTLSKLEEVRDKINELGGNGLAVVCDVVDKDSVINAKKVVNDTFGKVDILVNGAGGNHPKGTTTKEYFEKGDIENLPLDILEPIAKALETTPAYLMGWESKVEENPVETANQLSEIFLDQELMETLSIYQSLDADKKKQARDFIYFLKGRS